MGHKTKQSLDTRNKVGAQAYINMKTQLLRSEVQELGSDF